MKKIIFLSALIMVIILKVSQGGWEYVELAVALGSVVGIWLLARSFIFAQRLPLFPEISALFFLISPWHILISKDVEKSLNLFLTIFGIYILGKVFKNHLLVISTIFLIIFILITGPMTNLLNGFSNTQVPVWTTDEQRREHGFYYNYPLVVLAHNKVINYTLSFFDHYSQHFQGDFLFISGDVRGGGGLMYLFDFIFIIWALIFIIRNPKGWGIILIMLILSPIPSALDFQPPNALKAYLMIVPLTILSALGASYIFKKLYQKMKAIRLHTGIFLILTLFLILSVFVILPNKSFATGSDSDNQFVTIVNPIRVSKYTKNLQNSFEAQYQETQKRNLPATWLLTYDVLENSEMTARLGKIDKSHELGIFLEITSNFANKAEIEYNKTDSWHRAHALFLSGYKQEDRDKLIDTVFEKFKLIFGYYPKSVGVWWVDSYSLDYMQQKYNIVANLGLADQFATDGYQVWGQYWSTPFIPNKYHAGVPANSLDKKINLVTIEWAPRDPLNGYGLNPANNYSTQDYFTINLTDDYFAKLLDLYSSKNFNKFGQITIGLETDLDPSVYRGNYARWLDIAKSKNVKFLTMSDFGRWYLNNYQITPPQTIITDDLLGSQKKAIWYQSPFYRIGINYDDNTNKSEVFDFRIYPGNFEEPHYLSPNRQLNLFINLPSVIDKASNPDDGWVISEKKLTDIKREENDLIIKFGDQEIRFTENNILLSNINSLPTHLKTSSLLKIKSWFSNITIIPQAEYFIPQGGLIFKGLSIETRYFLSRPKVQLLTKTIILSVLLVLYLLIKSKLTKRVKLTIVTILIAVTSIGGFVLYYSNSQKFGVSQSEADALSHLAALPYGKVVVFDDGCLICTYHTKYPPPSFANNRGYVQTISKKPIVYNLKIFKAKTRSEGREELKKLNAKYIYVTKFEEYQEKLPFSPGDYFIDMLYENANAQIWKIRDNAPF